MSEGLLQFHFHQCLGKGGFGEVYLASVTRPGGLKRKAAVKVLKEGLRSSTEAVSRLRDEGRMLAILNHPNILRAQELVKIRGRVSLVMEYVEGIDLARVAKKGRLLPPRVIVLAMGRVADALDCALNTPSPETGRPLNLIHRDIKPENIRVSVHGQVKLLDFGIARTTEMHRNAHTQVGDMPFTPGYASPEAFITGKQGPESDIYALGASMYRLIAGERFYQGVDLTDQVATAMHPDSYNAYLAKRLAPVEDEVLRALLERLLDHAPEDRPTAKETRELCEAVAEEMDGPTLSRFVRAVTFPPPRSVKEASLTGMTLTEDGGGLTESSESSPPPRPSSSSSQTIAPPPVPQGIHQAVKPETGRIKSGGGLTPPKWITEGTHGKVSDNLADAKTVLHGGGKAEQAARRSRSRKSLAAKGRAEEGTPVPMSRNSLAGISPAAERGAVAQAPPADTTSLGLNIAIAALVFLACMLAFGIVAVGGYMFMVGGP